MFNQLEWLQPVHDRAKQTNLAGDQNKVNAKVRPKQKAGQYMYLGSSLITTTFVQIRMQLRIKGCLEYILTEFFEYRISPNKFNTTLF